MLTRATPDEDVPGRIDKWSGNLMKSIFHLVVNSIPPAGVECQGGIQVPLTLLWGRCPRRKSGS